MTSPQDTEPDAVFFPQKEAQAEVVEGISLHRQQLLNLSPKK
jgi:hypothetical protein